MDSTSISTSRFRFRDHNEELVDGETSEGHSSSDSSSFSSSEDLDPDLQSMTAQGVQHLCSELLELKQESNEDFQKNIFSNYSAFLSILKEVEGLQNELSGLKRQAFSQKRLIQDVNGSVSVNFLLEETKGSIYEALDVQSSSSNILEAHIEDISQVLDTLLLEHRLDDALALLETEGDIFQDLQSKEKFSADRIMSYNSIISEKRAMLTDQLTLAAEHPRVSAPELQKALFGLRKLGNNDLATQILIQYYHSRIASSIRELQNSEVFQDVLYIQEVAKYVYSMISQAVRSFVALNGDGCSYPSELSQWVSEEIGVFASCFKKYIVSISEISGRLSTAVDALQIAMSYCSLLESQRIFLKSSLIEHIQPCMEEIFRTHIDHLSKVISIFTSTDTWALGKYSVPGILTGRNYAVIDQLPEYLFLTNSGRKFTTLIQSVAEYVSPLIPLQMESSILKGIMDLFTAYIVILERALIVDPNIIQDGVSPVNIPESTTQGILILRNLSTLIQFSACIIKNSFDGISQLDLEIENYELLIQDVYDRLKSGFLGQFISNIFSSNVDHQCGPEACVSLQDDSRSYDLIPSVPYLELYLEIKKLQKLAEDDCIDVNWLIDMLKEIMDTTFEWISSKCDIWTIKEENLDDHRVEFMQFMLDAQFLVQTARYGGYLSDDVMNISSHIVSRLEESFISAGMSPLRDSTNDERLANAAIRALQKLQEIHAADSLQNENSDTVKEESQHSASSDAITEVDSALSEDSNTVDKTIENSDGDEEHCSFSNKELHGDGETEKSELNIQEEELIEAVKKLDDSPQEDDLPAQLVHTTDTRA